MKIGDSVIIDKHCKATITYIDDNLIQIEHNDMTRQLIKRSLHKIELDDSKETN